MRVGSAGVKAELGFLGKELGDRERPRLMPFELIDALPSVQDD